MQAVILAAGRGVRMGELTANCPKPMLRILGKPLLEWKLELLPKGIDEVIFVIGYLGNCIQDYFGDEWKGRKIRYVKQATLNGTGGAIRLVQDVVRGKFLVTMGDDLYTTEDLLLLMREDVALLAQYTDRAAAFGIIETSSEGELLSVVERPHGKREALVSTNAFLLDERFFDYPLVAISETEFGLPQTLASMRETVPARVIVTENWQPIGQPEDIASGAVFLQKHRVEEGN